MADELVAKARLYLAQAKADESRIPEVSVKMNELSIQMTKYKKELLLIEKTWDEIEFKYGN